MFDPPPFNPELPCETIAENTFEALRIVRQGDWVYKFLRPHDSFPGQTAEERQRQKLLRMRESHRHLELNPLEYDEQSNCLLSRYIGGRPASTKELYVLFRHFRATGRRHIADLTSQNLRLCETRIVVIDLQVIPTEPERTFQDGYSTCSTFTGDRAKHYYTKTG